MRPAAGPAATVQKCAYPIGVIGENAVHPLLDEQIFEQLLQSLDEFRQCIGAQRIGMDD